MRWLVVGMVLVSLVAGCSRVTRHTYHVTQAQLDQMATIAGITPCTHGPTMAVAVRREHGGGLVHVECLKRRSTP